MERNVNTNAVDKFDRTHRHTEFLRSFIDLRQRDTGFGKVHRFGHIRSQYAVNNERCTP